MDNREASLRVRNLLTEQGESAANLTLPHIQAIIPTALENWTRSCFTDRRKRDLFKCRFNAEVADGRLDLTPFLDGTDGRINLKELREVPIYSGEAMYTLYRTISTVSGIDTDVEVSQAGDITEADVGNRVVILDADGVALVETTVATYVDASNFTLTDGADGAFSEATAKLYTLDDCEYQEGSAYTWLNSMQQLKTVRPLGSDNPACFLDGSNLRTRTAAGRFDGADNIVFTVTSFPKDITEISKELEHDFILFLAALAVKEIGASA